MSLVFRRFEPETDTHLPFNCGHPDLNDFLTEVSDSTPNATLYQQERLSVTYVVEDSKTHNLLAYFSLLNDKIERELVDHTIWNRLSRRIPNAKRRSSYPALKIGRLAISLSSQRKGLGRIILSFLQGWYYQNPSAGCRFITVDALRDAIGFYRKCDFVQLVPSAPNDETTLMFFDIKSIEQSSNLT